MSIGPSLIFATAILASAGAIAQEKPAANQSPPPEIKALAESCAARKFETIVEVTVGGKKRSSKVKLCGKEGQTDADWANTLRDAVKKVEANEKMAPVVKNQISAAFNAEIAKIEGSKAAASAPLAAIAPRSARPEVVALPPLPTRPAVAPPSSRPTPMAAARKPRLTIQCLTPAEPGNSCISMRRNTLLTIRADEELVGGTRLRFLRGRDVRGEIAIAPMRQGQTLRYKLPQPLCSGVYRSTVEIQVLGRGTSGAGANPVTDTLGPYELRC